MVPLNRAPENWPLRAPPPQDLRWLWVEDVSAVAACRNAALALADRLQFPAARADQLGLAVTEAASNLHKHASEGSLWLAVNRDDDPPGIDLVTIDAGPGLADVDLALRDGHSTAGTLGIGLGAIRRLADFCDDLLDVAKAESGQLHTDPAHVDLAALFGRLLGLARPMAGDKPVTVTVSADGDPDTPATILTDEVALTGILRNLLSNGIKYTDRGEVRLSVRVTGSRLEIIVADTGIGIPAGLPDARRLARILGGDLTLTSEPGAGTTVVLDLPRQPPRLGTVLLADDDARFRKVLRGMLDGLAGRVLEAADGGQALAMAKDNPVDLILADMRMPGLDGGALLARLPAAVPAIIITSADLPPPPRAAALLRKDELTAERLEFTIRGVAREPS